jgi:predicted dehydrogenase
VSMRIAVLGLGFMGSTHVKAWKNIHEAELAAVYSKDEKKLTGDLSDIQGNLGGPAGTFDFENVRKYRDIPELLNDPEIDAVDICLPTHLHYATAMAALKAGKHVLVEKPIALDGRMADELVQYSRDKGLTLMAAQVLRFFPSYRALAEEIASHKHGEVRSAVFRRRCAAPAWSKWLGDSDKSGGGVFDLLIHDVDFALMLFGMPDAISATGHEDMPLGIDTIHATFYYKDLAVIVTGGWFHKKTFPFSMEYTVVADGGTFDYSSRRGDEVTFYDCDGQEKSVPLRSEDGFEAELRYFHSCLMDGSRPNYCMPEDSAAAVKLARLMLEARKRNGEKIPCQF